MFKHSKSTYAAAFLGLAVCAALVGSVKPKRVEASPLLQTAPSLGTVGSFAILAGTAITNVPTSAITGDVGLSPSSGSNYSGLTCVEVTGGTIYSVDAGGPLPCRVTDPALLTDAKNDLVSAFDALDAGANANANCIAPYTFGSGNKDLVGANLAPGVYCADTFTLTGTLTLSGSGVWVFKSAATLITSGTANVVGGDPCNVFWRVPSSATLGTNTSLKGSILALTSISLQTGAALNGRALARNAAVTLAKNNVSLACASQSAQARAQQAANAAARAAALRAKEVPEADTLLLFGGGIGGLATWLGWQLRKVRARSKK